MTWTKLGQEFPDEARGLTDGELRTHVEALCWSNRRGLDLQVPKRDLTRFAETDERQAAADGLVAKGWWADRGAGWYVGLRFPEWQLEKSVVDHRRDGNALRVRRHRMHMAGDHSICLPKNCEAARVMRDDIRYVTRYVTDDPVRNGTERSTRAEGPVQAPADANPGRDADRLAPSRPANPAGSDGSNGEAGQAQQFRDRGTASQQGTDRNARAHAGRPAGTT